MTAILGYADGKSVWIGADSQCVGGWTPVDIGTRRKLFRKRKMLFGMAGASATCDTVSRSLVVPQAASAKSNPLVYLNDILAPAIYQCLTDHHLSMIVGDYHAGIVLGMQGELYYGNTDLFFRPIAERVFSLGSADGIVEGAFRAYRDCGMEVEKALLNAMTMGAKRCLAIAAPFYVEKLS